MMHVVTAAAQALSDHNAKTLSWGVTLSKPCACLPNLHEFVWSLTPHRNCNKLEACKERKSKLERRYDTGG